MVWMALACASQLAQSENTVADFLSVTRQEKDVKQVITDSDSAADDDILSDLYEESETVRVDSVEVLDLIGVSATSRKRISDAMRKVDDPAFEVATDVRENGTLLRILLRKDGNRACEVVALIGGTDDCAVIRMQGAFAETSEILGRLMLPLLSLRMHEMETRME